MLFVFKHEEYLVDLFYRITNMLNSLMLNKGDRSVETTERLGCL